MRVACVNQDPGIRPGGSKGAAVHVAAMRAAFADCGAEVSAFDEKGDDALMAALVERHGRSPLDLVYERYALGCVAGSRFATRHGVPHVLEVNAPLLDEATRYRLLPEGDRARLQRLEHEVFGGARRILAVSRAVAENVRAGGVPRERVVVAANAVDGRVFRPRAGWLDRGDPGAASRCGALAAVEAGPVASLPADTFVVGFHGRLRPWHGLPLLVEAFLGLLARGVDAHLLLVGEGDFEGALAGRLPADRLTRLGWRSQAELAPLVARFDALALTYAPDAPCFYSPLKLLEAMAAGVVPVVPRLGDLPDIVVHGRNGLLYPAGDATALTAMLEVLASSAVLRRRLAAAARSTAEQRSWTSIAADVLACVTPTDVR